ncbi:MAG: tail fiber protein [Anaerolineales bacterium]|nr:tail fiber protein [Anaerolineales bacterium]
MDFLIGQICMFPWDWAPRGWVKCDGQLLRIEQNTALFALIGTEFGGDGVQTFALPKLAPIKSENGGDVDYYINLRGIFPARD